MKIRQAITVATLLLAPIGANTSAVAAEPIEVAIASPPAPTAAPSPTAVTHSADPATPPDEPRAVFDDLTTDILKVMNKWPVARIPHANYEDVASDIALVVHEFGNVWPGGEPIAQAHKSGILLAALAYWEGARFAAYVDDGRCNEWMTAAMAHPIRHMDSKTGIAVIYPNYGVLDAEARKLIGYGDCDHGNAHSLWQVWPYGDFTAERLKSRRDAVLAALMLARGSFEKRGNLSCYTGESATVHPKADERERFARRFY